MFCIFRDQVTGMEYIRASNELMPHHVCTYLYELAQAFNRFYEGNRVVGDPRGADVARLVGRLEAGEGGNLARVLARVENGDWVFRAEPPRRGS